MNLPFPRAPFVRALRKEKYHWRRHVLERLLERGIAGREVLEALLNGECIEAYPEDTPYPSALFFGRSGARPLHAVAAFDAGGGEVYIITAYEPDTKHFTNDFKTRKKR